MTARERQFILGAAGHVDHGKAALITAPTGTNTDRLKEERERGISIELGFPVVAADEGVMPQTVEHLEILDSPGSRGCVDGGGQLP